MIPAERPSLQEMTRVAIDYTFFLNLAALAAAAVLLWLHVGRGREQPAHAE